MSLPRSMRGRWAARSAILVLTVTLVAGYPAAQGTAGSSNAAALVPAVAQPIGIIDDIARGSYRVLNTPRTPLAAQKAARATIRQGDELPASVRTRASAAADTRITAAEARITAAEATQIRARLHEHADAILHEISCDFVWTLLSPEEKDAEQALTTPGRSGAGQLVRTYSQSVSTATADAIGAAGRRAFFSRFGARYTNAVDWVEYGKDVHDKATELFDERTIADLQELIQIDGATHTRALVYYARACLKPPR